MPRTLQALRSFLLWSSLLIGASPVAAVAQQATPDSASLLANGEYLARAGDCIACHTAPEGKLFAGGLADWLRVK